MRRKGERSFFFSDNAKSLRGKNRMTGESLYYPRVMMRALAQVLTEEYSEYGLHVPNVVIDGTIDSPGARALSRVQNRSDLVMNPVRSLNRSTICTQDRSCWTHELQLIPAVRRTDRYARRVGVAATRQINKMPAAVDRFTGQQQGPLV